MFRFLFDWLELGGSLLETPGYLPESTSYNLSSLVMPSVYLRWSRVRFVSAPYLFSKSFKIFLLRWINLCESCWRCLSYSFLSRWMRLRRAA